MNFPDYLKQYMTQYHISLSELSAKTGVSKSMLSRLANGKKEATAENKYREKIAAALAELARQKGASPAKAEELRARLSEPAPDAVTDFALIRSNLNLLVEAFDINVNDLSRHLNFDASYLSRIRSGQRHPANVPEFCMGVSDFIALHYWKSDGSLPGYLTNNAPGAFPNPLSFRSAVYEWLTEHKPQTQNPMQHFLQQLDAFDLNEYRNAVPFDEKDVLSLPTQIPISKNYYTLEGFMRSELEWLHATALSSSVEPVFLYSDMPMEEMAKYSGFQKQWISGIASLLKKGSHLDIIHHINRQASEMMLGLEGWIPLYMTGQVSPYYLKNDQNRYFHHFLRVSGSAALSGEAIVGFHNEGQYHFTRAKEELVYYRKRGEALLAKAHPLMNIYRKADRIDYEAFFRTRYADTGCSHRSILPAPPVYTLSRELLLRILLQNHAPEEDVQKLETYLEESKALAETFLASSPVTDEIPLLSENAFDQYPPSLPVADLFLEKEYSYNYSDYREHLRLTEIFANSHSDYHYRLTRTQPFRNIQIRMAEGSCVIISKSKTPAIHFAICHPKLRQAIEAMP